MTEKELKELEKFAKENGYNDELKDIYLREVIDRNKEYECCLLYTSPSPRDTLLSRMPSSA